MLQKEKFRRIQFPSLLQGLVGLTTSDLRSSHKPISSLYRLDRYGTTHLLDIYGIVGYRTVIVQNQPMYKKEDNTKKQFYLRST
jgi:hypothetical protein